MTTLLVLATLSPSAWAGDYGSIRMPLTPSDPRDEFIGMKKKKRASTVPWTSLTPGFTCSAVGDYVEVKVQRSTWPGVVPEKVLCESELGVVKMKVQLYDEVLKTMFVGDGTLVLARSYGESAEFEGPPPRRDVGVQQGNTGLSGIYCKIEPGPVLQVRAKDTTEDVATVCKLRTTTGDTYELPIVLRTATRANP